MAANICTCCDLSQRIIPPLQAHFCDHLLARHPRRTRNLYVKGKECEEPRPKMGWCSHHRPKTDRISLLKTLCAGEDIFIKHGLHVLCVCLTLKLRSGVIAHEFPCDRLQKRIKARVHNIGRDPHGCPAPALAIFAVNHDPCHSIGSPLRNPHFKINET